MGAYQEDWWYNYKEETLKHDEFLLQCQIVEYLNNNGVCVFSVPNHLLKNGVAEAKREMAAGFRKGIPDLICLKPNARCIFMELKTEKGKRSIEQEAIADTIQALGFEYRLVRSVADVEDLI